MGDWHDRDGDEPGDPPENLPAPWEQPDYGADADPPHRRRHDAFTPARRAKFLKRLAKYGCLMDAAKRTGVSIRTVYKHQDRDEAFARDCALAVRMAAGPIELVAWQRAVEGVDQLFACGGEVYTRKRYSDGLLRLLLQGSNPKKYGARPGFTRKRLLAWERKRIEQDIRAEMAAREKPFDQVIAQLMRRINAVRRADEEEKLAAGWMKAEDGYLIPPGWTREDGAAPTAGESAAKPEAGETPRDSL